MRPAIKPRRLSLRPLICIQTAGLQVLHHLEKLRVRSRAKVTHLTSIKPDIKQRNIAITPIFEALRLAIASQHSSLSTAGFSALGHLLKRLYIQEHGLLFRTYVPSLVACLEDADSGVREMAEQTIIELFQYASARHLPSLSS
jgi:CLIP-associating protein 1/2